MRRRAGDADEHALPSDQFLDGASDDEIRDLVVDVDRLLRTTSVADVPRVLRALRSAVELGGDPRLYVQWLEEIRLAAVLRLKRNGPRMTDVRPTLDVLLDDIDEELAAEGMILVGHFFWILRGMERGLTDAQMHELSERAWAIVRQRYPSRLVWSVWPTDLATATPADESTPLEFDLDPDGPVGEPLLVLVLET